MFGSGIIDVAIGVILVYLFLSLICSVITEWISKRLETRAKNLEEGIRSLLSDPEGKGYSAKFFNHPLIKGLTQNGKKASYIPSSLFAVAKADVDWTTHFFQYANRLAHLQFLRFDNKLSAFLVFIYFIGDQDVNGPLTKEEWLGAIALLYSFLGIRHTKLAPFIWGKMTLVDTKVEVKY